MNEVEFSKAYSNATPERKVLVEILLAISTLINQPDEKQKKPIADMEKDDGQGANV